MAELAVGLCDLMRKGEGGKVPDHASKMPETHLGQMPLKIPEPILDRPQIW